MAAMARLYPSSVAGLAALQGPQDLFPEESDLHHRGGDSAICDWWMRKHGILIHIKYTYTDMYIYI